MGSMEKPVTTCGLNGTGPGSVGTNNERIMKRITAVTPRKVNNNEN
jgi:dihydroxyacetone kinase DhaKLM complex PTS-EIIA-like component DhaM